MIRAVFLFAASVVVLGGLALRPEAASAEKTIHVDPARLEQVQDGCLAAGAFGLDFWEFSLTGGPRPDITVSLDTDGDGDEDREATIASEAGGFSAAVYRLTGQGLVLDAFAIVPDDWDGVFALSTGNCDHGAPPADACEPFPGRIVFELNELLGDPKYGLRSIVEIPQGQVGDGIYDVTLKSFDAHLEHGGQGQEHESWRAAFPVRLSFVETEDIDDLPDGQDVINQKVGQVRLQSDPSHIVLLHEQYTAPNQLDRFETPESVTAVCVALDRVGDVPAVPGAPE